MDSRSVSTVATAIAIMAGVVCTEVSQADQSAGARSSDTTARPLMLASDEGELRTRRIHTDSSSPASSQFILKVSPKNNGSKHLVAGTELLAQERHYRSTDTWCRMNPVDRRRNGPRVARRSGARSPCWRAGVHPGEHLDKWEEHRRHSNRVNVRLLGARVRGDDAMQFGAGR